MSQSKYQFLLRGSIYFLSGILLLLFILALCPTQLNVSAEEYPADKQATEGINTDAHVWIKPTLSVAIDPRINIDVTPRKDGAFQTGSASLDIATNSRNGFKILMNSVDGTSLVSADNNTIPSITEDTASTAFTLNAWGYNIDTTPATNSTVYHPIPDTATVIAETTTSTASNSYNLTFGTKIDASVPSGRYTNAVVISVVANPNEAVNLNDLTYMQEVRTEYCSATAEGTSKVLIDYRDGKKYSVLRAKDGTCWMQSNLALNLSTDKTLTPNDSDVLEDWTPSSNTRTTLSVNNDPNGQESWNYNTTYYYQFNAATAGTGSSAVDPNSNATSSICPRGWKLPLGNDYTGVGSFQDLKTSYGSPNADFFVAAPFYMARLRWIENGKHNGNGGEAMFISSTVVDESQIYVLNLGTYGVSPTKQMARQYGMNIRCVVR